MEGLSRSISRGLSRCVSTSLDVNKVWRRRTSDGFDGRRSMKTAQFGKSQGMFWKIKKLFNLSGSGSQHYGARKTSKVRQASNLEDDFQNRLLFEIYKDMSSSRDVGSV